MEELNFDEMRNQIAILKDKLDKESIINERLMKESLKNKVSTINAQGWKSVVCGLFVIIIFPVFHFSLNFSWLFVITTIVMMSACIFFTWWFHRPINENGLLGKDVKTVAEAFAKVKRLYHLWLVYVTPTMMLPWITWYCYELTKDLGLSSQKLICFCIFIGISGIIGGLIGYRWHRKVVNTCQSVVEQLETEEEQ